MAALCVDTHAIVWFLLGDPSLSTAARTALREATANGDPIYVPSVVLVELTYLVEKRRVPPNARDELTKALDDPAGPLRLAPLNRAVADALEFVVRKEVPDLPDRIVCATALALRTPLVSRDGKIRAAAVETIW